MTKSKFIAIIHYLSIKPWRIVRKSYYYIQRTYCFFIYSLFNPESFTKHRSSVPWVVLLSTSDTFLRISWRHECIANEIKNMRYICENHTLDSFIIPHQYKKYLWYHVITFDRKYPISSDPVELFDASKSILSRFKQCGKERYINGLEELEQISTGIQTIEALCDKRTTRICVDQMKELVNSGAFYIGPAHGDFHSNNILKDANGSYYPIDFDCLRTNGIQAFDAIYFMIEYFADINRITWYEQLVRFLERKQIFSPIELSFWHEFCPMVDTRWLLMFFLDRIGQDRILFASVWEMPVLQIYMFMETYIRVHIHNHHGLC